MTEQAAEAGIDSACPVLRLPTIRERFTEIADAAQRKQLTYRGFLAELLLAECEDRDTRRAARRRGVPRDNGSPTSTTTPIPTSSPRSSPQLEICAWVAKG